MGFGQLTPRSTETKNKFSLLEYSLVSSPMDHSASGHRGILRPYLLVLSELKVLLVVDRGCLAYGSFIMAP